MEKRLKRPITPDDASEMSECFNEITKALDNIKERYDSLNYKSARTLVDMFYWYELSEYDLDKFFTLKMDAIKIFLKNMSEVGK